MAVENVCTYLFYRVHDLSDSRLLTLIQVPTKHI